MTTRSDRPFGGSPTWPGGTRLGDLLEALPVGIALRDAQGGLLLRNRLAREADLSALEEYRQSVDLGGQRCTVSVHVDIARHRAREEELFRRAYFDDLTKLPNRAFLERAVADLLGQPGPPAFALAFIDVDNFKHINDYYSHAVGDEILVKIARRIGAELREGDVLARIGGDEFVLLLHPAASAEEAGADVEHLLARLMQPFLVGDHEIFASASIGVSLCPQHGTDYEVLRRNADLAMYRVKGDHKGAVAMFDEGMRNAASLRMETEQRLRLAIRDRRFLCAFQPKVDIRSRETVGVEVLLRWRDERGIIQAPGEVIGLAVELGLINDITHMVLAETVDALDVIDAHFGPRTRISVNVAARQAGDLAFMTSLTDHLLSTGCAERFMVELTEEAFFAKSELQASILPALRRMGTQVSIDDFGIGYSSLSALADLEADEIKIDRSFITDIHRRPRSQSILKAIESLGGALGMAIVAEGLETFEELAYLSAATRIRYAQGYYFSKPCSLDQLVSSRTVSHPSRSVTAARATAPSRMAGSRG